MPSKTTASASENYLIRMNEKLRTENENFKKELSDLDKAKSDLEDEVDRTDRTRSYTKNLMKNFIIVDRLRVKLVKRETLILKEITQKCFKKMSKGIYNIFGIYLMFILLLMPFLEYQFTIINTTFLGAQTVYTFFYVLKEKESLKNEYESKSKSLAPLIKEIIEIEKSQDFITDHIDSL